MGTRFASTAIMAKVHKDAFVNYGPMLLAWTSPSYPTGAFSYSHGLEWAVETGGVHDSDTLVNYIDAVLTRGGGWVDAVLFARAYECAHDSDRFDEIAELAAAFRGSSETALESQQQGAAFLLVTRRAWPHPWLDAFVARHGDYPIAHSIAMALACAAHGVPLEARCRRGCIPPAQILPPPVCVWCRSARPMGKSAPHNWRRASLRLRPRR